MLLLLPLALLWTASHAAQSFTWKYNTDWFALLNLGRCI
jgi:hypothetical protein